MSEKILNGADVGAALEEMSRERMAQTMACGGLRDGCFSHGGIELPLHGCLMEVVAGDFSAAGMRAEGGGCEDVLPAPLPGCIRPFPQQQFRHVDVTRADGEVLEMFVTEPGQMLREPLLQGASHSLRASSAISAALRFDLLQGKDRVNAELPALTNSIESYVCPLIVGLNSGPHP